jgi:uncharacterized protein
MELSAKCDKLKNYIKELGSTAVAFSGGVDSTFLLKTAVDVLGDSVLAITVRSCLFPKRELNDTFEYCKKEGIRHVIFDANIFEVEGLSKNPVNRCYLCKNAILKGIWEKARENGMNQIIEGSNMDDGNDFRPGFQAVVEQGVKSPLKYAGLYKDEIRQLSKTLGLAWDRPSFACLATRIPYGEDLTIERLKQIEDAEDFLLELGLRQLRVRYHDNLARIETDEAGFSILSEHHTREHVHKRFTEIGFTYTAIDLFGYRMGSMNDPEICVEKV